MPSKPQPIYREGMAVIDPTNSSALSTESQTGTWFEDRLEVERLVAASANGSLSKAKKDAPLIPRKRLQRRSCLFDSSATAQPVKSSQSTEPTTFHTNEALDTIINSLGTEWACLSDDDLLRSASRGWAKYIQRHYSSLDDVEILLRFKDKNMCLVRTNEGIFLFKEDLSEGRLVAKTWEACVVNLRATPMVFEGTNSLKAEKHAINPSTGHMAESSKPSPDASTHSVDVSLSPMELD